MPVKKTDPKIESCELALRSRSGIAETIDVWKKTMQLKLKTLWRHIIKLTTIGQPSFCSEALSLLHQVINKRNLAIALL